MRIWKSFSLLFFAFFISGCEENKQVTLLEGEEYEGKVRSSIKSSTPDFIQPLTAKPDSPNIIIVLADDLGFADIGSYGSEIKTPILDQIADNGLLFSHFTVTPICSSSRAALLTGLNHHSIGTGWLAEWDFGFPGYRGEPTKNALMLPEILKEHGYATYMVGKWHLTNAEHRSRIGPFDSWPLGRGFERYWGFLDGEASQWKPHVLIQGNEYIQPPNDPNFYLPDVLTDKAIGMISDLRAHDPVKPFLLYYATGATHAPHHVKQVDRQKYAEKYNMGWDQKRRQRLAKQIELGIAPMGTKLSDNTPGVQPWDQLTPEQQKMYARFQENYAGFVDNLDQNIGRLVHYLKETGEWENTIFVFTSDNGGSREVGLEGASNALRYYHSKPSTNAQNLVDYENIGDESTHPHYPLGWMQVSNTPFIHSKRTTHGGGIRAPLLVSWPAGITKPGVRHQYHHIIDITPTLLDILDIKLPESFQGMPIKPLEGISMRYTFANEIAEPQKSEQYYEVEGHRGYYKDGWKIISYREPNQSFDKAQWQLFNINEDFSESTDLAEQYPDIVEALEKKWFAAAERYNVFPIIDVPLLERPMYTKFWYEPARNHFNYTPPVNTINRFKGPILPNHSFTITADIERNSETQQGVLAALGDNYSGYSFYIKDNHLVYELNVAHSRVKLVSSKPLPIGNINVQYRFDKVNLAWTAIKGLARDGIDFDKMSVLKGVGSLYINGEKVAEEQVPQPLFAVWEGLDIGRDQLAPVSKEYEAPFEFDGKLLGITYDLE